MTTTTTDQATTDQARRRYFGAFRGVFGAAGTDAARREMQLLVVGKPSAARDADSPMTVADFDRLTARLDALAEYRRSGSVAPPAPEPAPEPQDDDAEFDRIMKGVRSYSSADPFDF